MDTAARMTRVRAAAVGLRLLPLLGMDLSPRMIAYGVLGGCKGASNHVGTCVPLLCDVQQTLGAA